MKACSHITRSSSALATASTSAGSSRDPEAPARRPRRRPWRRFFAIAPAEHCTANGKAVLAQLADDEIRELLPAKLSRYTPATITSRAALLEELARVRETGVACDREEHTSGISAGGVAVRNPMGTFAALSVPMPTMRFEGQETIIGAALAEAHEELATSFDD